MTKREWIKQEVDKMKKDASLHTRVYSSNAMAIINMLDIILIAYETDNLKEFLESEKDDK